MVLDRGTRRRRIPNQGVAGLREVRVADPETGDVTSSQHVHNKFCHGLDCMDEEPGPTLDELVAVLLDALNVEDLRQAARVCRFTHHAPNNGDGSWLQFASALDRAADALAALREAQQ